MKSNTNKKWPTLDDIIREVNLSEEEVKRVESGANLYLMLAQIRYEKEQRSLSNEKLAQLSNIPRPEVSKILNGKTNVSILRLQALARALGKRLVIKLEPLDDAMVVKEDGENYKPSNSK